MRAKRTNIEIDETKLNRAKKIAGLRSTRAVVDYALERLGSSQKSLNEIFKLQGKIHFEKNYNYKESR